ncbi:MAG: 3-deoxy-manno-octulosonate cytidylyltransferase [Nitrospiraceae bacterium]
MARRSGPITVVIPARFGSSRFPGKPLVKLLGKPIIQHVYERARACRVVDDVWVATDDVRIHDIVEAFGGRAIMSTQPFRTGTDRVAAVAEQSTGEYFVNLQGDEIILHPAVISDLVKPFLESGADMGTLKRRLDSERDLHNRAVVKVVTAQGGEALYFSRAPIPLVRDNDVSSLAPQSHFVHLGLYMFTRQTLRRMAALPTGTLEEVEKLEQLRALEHGIRIRVWETTHRSLRIDTPDDVPEAEKTLQQWTSMKVGAI